MDSNPIFDHLNAEKKPRFQRTELSKVVSAFPSDLNMNSIRRFNAGPYALRLAPYYLHHSKEIKVLSAKVVNPKGVSQIIYKFTGLVSRFSHKRTRTVYVIPAALTQGILTYCSCKCGTRTIGACSHGTTVLYLIYATVNRVPPPSFSKRFFKVLDISSFAKPRRAEKKGRLAVADKSDTVRAIAGEDGDDEEGEGEAVVEEGDSEDSGGESDEDRDDESSSSAESL